MTMQFTQNGRKAILWSQEEAMRLGHVHVEPEHLLLGTLHGEDSGAIRLLDRLGIAASQVRDKVTSDLPPANDHPSETSQMSPAARGIVEGAIAERDRCGEDYVGTEHLLLSLLRNAAESQNGLFTGLDLTYERAAGVLSRVRTEKISPPLEVRDPSPAARPGFLKGRHLLSISDLSLEEITELFELTREIKSGRHPENGRGKTLALLFEKPSLRTKVTFSVAINRLGGQSIYLSRDEVGLGVREPVADAARCLSRWVDAIAARTFSHETVTGLAEFGSVPVVNALTDVEHPCQALADFYTILEKKSDTRGMKLVFVGDGNNVAHSLMLLAPLMGTHFALACPPGYEPDAKILERAQTLARQYGTQMVVTSDALEAAYHADVLYTDVWTSMGQEEESQRRMNDFAAFQINDEMLREAKEDVLVLHCLPAHRGQEITDAAMEGSCSGVFDQAENRLHVQEALLAAVL